MATSTATKTVNGLTITVTIVKSVSNKIAYADGDNINLGRETYDNTTIELHKDGNLVVLCRDKNFFYPLTGKNKDNVTAKLPTAYARLSDAYVSEETYNLICSVMADAEADIDAPGEYADVKSAEDAAKTRSDANLAKAEAEYNARSQRHGWCNKCQSYCYGDCQAA